MQYYARVSDDGCKFQPLKEHTLNVANYSQLFGTKNDLANICRLAGLLHDMGKCSMRFQRFIRKAAEYKQAGQESPRSNFDHGVYGAAFLVKDNKQKSKQAEFQHNASERQFFVQFLSMIICYHHGGLGDYVKVLSNYEFPLRTRINSLDDEALATVAATFFQEVITRDEYEEQFKLALAEFNALFAKIYEAYNSCDQDNDKNIAIIKAQTNFNIHMMIKFVYSCLVDADCLDAYNFDAEVKRKAEASILPALDDYLNNLNKKIEFFKNHKEDIPSKQKINALRNMISDRCAETAKSDTGIHTLTVPTGGGKTLASLRFALEHLKYHQGKSSEKDRIFYIIPYTTIIEQNAQETREALGCGDEALLEHHSSIKIDDEQEKEQLSTRQKKYQKLSERWDIPIVFTSQVQFFNTIFGPGTSYIRKLHTLANSVIIFDEVQTIPLKCTYLANAVYNSLSEFLNTSIILCTATQPNLSDLNVPVNLSNEYPELMSDPEGNAESFKRMEVIDIRDKVGREFDGLIDFISSLAAENESILTVMNTKTGVKEIYEGLRKTHLKDRCFYLTTYMCAKHRKKQIEDIKNKLAAHEPIILISTNLIECGVDLSFHYVIRNLAGLPSIVQSSGRGNRHGSLDISQSFIVDVNESIGPLQELQYARECTKDVLKSYSDDPNKFNNSLLNQKAIDIYYANYTKKVNIENKMSYPIKVNKNFSVEAFNLFSGQNLETRKSTLEQGIVYDFPFRFVAKYFQVIEDNTVSILVPYDSTAIKLQGKLMSEKHPLSEKNIFREIQPYVINVYEHDCRKMMEKGNLQLVPGTENFYILLDGAYSKEEGAHGKTKMDTAMP